MAKKAGRMIEQAGRRAAQAGQSVISGVEEKIEEFADDLGRLLGSAREKAEGWMGQRQALGVHLKEIRDTATDLLTRLGGEAEAVSDRRRSVASTGPRPGRPRTSDTAGRSQVTAAGPKKKRIMSPEARQAISDAQKARWARQKGAARASR